MAPEIEARIVELRRSHPGWGPRTILNKLRRELEEAPSRSAIYRCLVRHRLIDPKKRRRRREDYKRWERARSMELWQIDVMGSVFLTDAIDETGQVRLSLLDDLRFALRLLREFVPSLSATGDEIESAARSGPMQDPQVREATIQALKRLLVGEQMPPSSTTRITQVLEYLEQGGGVETP